MKKAKRVFLIVLDSVGAGCLPDASEYGDEGANTLLTISKSPMFFVPNMRKMGYFNIDGVELAGVDAPKAAYGRLMERSKGKDTTIGHWEIAGVISEKPLPVFPNGFPDNIISVFCEKAGCEGVLANMPYSGTEVIRDYGEEHIKTGKPIVYTSADSVFQIAVHEEHYGLERLYDTCNKARAILQGEYGVGRVIARPFVGEDRDSFVRTSNRRDFALEPPEKTLLDAIKESGLNVISVGKIRDIFAGRGITRAVITHGNAEGMEQTLELAKEEFSGLCFVNLVDFDMLYGHRNDIDGYAAAMSAFDAWLPSLTAALNKDDVLMITADHGCDPGYPGTDHTREYIPLLVYGDMIKPKNIGTRSTFADIAATAADLLGNNSGGFSGESFANLITE